MANVHIKKEDPTFYYLKTKYGTSSWGSYKMFVRIPYKKKNGQMGSKYYCTSKYDAILFDHPSNAYDFTKTFKADWEIATIKLPDNAFLEECQIDGIKCYICKNCFAGKVYKSLGITL